ncbi:MAG: CoA transferase [Rhodopseudomonas palustris]|uniref:CoA transferase n=1 Tax=Rhodopseudomonas palustris TaxID=1076 RepID=A0A933RTJ1_RHOPL|nr:CoA transferase [Rhodopseudomonas palustris]
MLKGMRVLGFTHFVQGPAASQYLADLGADVIKVEPLTGAFERGYAADSVFVDGFSATFFSVNRNKRSISVDLKSERGREVVFSLIKTADVIIENYRGGVLERLGFGYEAVKAVKPDIIYASATGWGSSGPMASAPGQDLLVQARCGLIAVTGNLDTAPTVTGVPVVDQHGAALLAMAVSAAYARKLATGEGTRIESNLLSAGLDLQSESMAAYYSGGRGPDRIARDHRLASWFLPAPYGVFKLADCHAVISLGGDIESFAAAIGTAELIELAADRMANRDAFMRVLGDELQSWTYERLDKALSPHGLWYERVQDYDAVRRDPQVVHNESFQEFAIGDLKGTVVAHPVRYDGKIPEMRRMPQGLGGDTRDVLADAGWSADDIEALVRDGVVATGPQQSSAAPKA